MKEIFNRSWFRIGLGSLIFILLFCTLLSLVTPFYRKITSEIKKIEDEISLSLQEKTGLSFSYGSLSPSIFSSLNINDISVFDSETERKILSIKRASLSYKFMDLVKTKSLDAVTGLTLNGVSVELDSVKDSQTLIRLKNLLSKNKNDENLSLLMEENSKKKNVDFSKGNFNLPFDVFIKNLSLHYFNSQYDFLAKLNHVKLSDFDSSDAISVASEGRFFYRTELLKSQDKRSLISCYFNLNGNLFPYLNGSSATINLSKNPSADYSISAMSFLANFEDSKFMLRSLKSVIPFSFSVQADLENSSFDISSQFQEFDPFSILLVKNKSSIMEKIQGSLVSGEALVKIQNGKTFSSLNVSSSVNEKLLGFPFDFSADFSGNEKFVSVKKFSAQSDFVDADFTGNIDIKKMQPSGVLTLNKFSLKNGGIISSEVYVEPYKKGIMCFAPEVSMTSPFGDSVSITAVQATVFKVSDSIDFSAEFYDYSHSDFDSAAKCKIDGSYLMGKNQYVQASVSVSDFFLDSAARLGGVLAEKKSDAGKKIKSLEETLSPYIFSGNIFFSTDFKNVVYNSSDCVLANTKEDDKILLFSVDGSKENLQISNMSLRFGQQFIQAYAGLDFRNGFKDFSFSTNFSMNSIPYNFSGNYTSGIFSVSGNYGFDWIVMRDEKSDGFFGSVSFSSLPFSVGKKILAFSTFSTFTWHNKDDFSVILNSFEFDEPSGKISFSPHVSLSGQITPKGFESETFVYSDSISPIDGSVKVLLNMPLGVFESAHSEIELKNPVSAETVSLGFDITNETHIPFSAEALKKTFKLSGQALVTKLPLARFVKGQNPKDNLTAQLVLSGTLEKPFVSISMEELYLLLNKSPLKAKANMILDESGFNIYEMTASWKQLELSSLSGSFNPSNFSGKLDASVDFAFMKEKTTVPLKMTLSGIPKEDNPFVPEFLTIDVLSTGLKGDFIHTKKPFSFTAMKIPEGIEIFTRNNEGFRASVSNSGKVSCCTGENNVISFDLNGHYEEKNTNLELTNLSVNLSEIVKFVKIPNVNFSSGVLSGNVNISGALGEPDFEGKLILKNSEFKVPLISSHSIKASDVNFDLYQGGISVRKALFRIGKGELDLNADMELLGLGFGDIKLDLETRDRKPVPIDMTFPLVHYKGYVGTDIEYIFSVPDFTHYVKGDVYPERGDVDVVVSSLQNTFNTIAFGKYLSGKNFDHSKMNAKMEAVVDLNIHAGQKFQLLFEPLLRGIISPKTDVAFQFDSSNGYFNLKGDIELKGGEVMWLNKNFYLREGILVCNESNSSIDPRITVKAETKERDEDGGRVTLALIAHNQRLSEFNPSFSTNPPKSEAEIMALLGQTVSGDAKSASDIVASSGDFFVQTLLLRKVENALRDILNFDIFSVRTNVIQNALKLRRDSKDQSFSVGNYFDNTTVYIGKYFGSSIYVDAMLNMTYDDDKNKTSSGFVFQPELGFEMESPFVNIRFSLAPDFESILNNSWLPSTSMTLSWKYSY